MLPHRPSRSLKPEDLTRVAGQIPLGGPLMSFGKEQPVRAVRKCWRATVSSPWLHAGFRCDDPEGHCCVVPQTPVGELSRDMQALNREIAERVSWCHPPRPSVVNKTTA